MRVCSPLAARAHVGVVSVQTALKGACGLCLIQSSVLLVAWARAVRTSGFPLHVPLPHSPQHAPLLLLVRLPPPFGVRITCHYLQEAFQLPRRKQVLLQVSGAHRLHPVMRF